MFWLTQIPLAYGLAASMDLGPNGVFWAIVISESLLTVLGVLVFRAAPGAAASVMQRCV